jgi:hypothetical protein
MHAATFGEEEADRIFNPVPSRCEEGQSRTDRSHVRPLPGCLGTQFPSCSQRGRSSHGRTNDLVKAIQEHKGGNGRNASEANAVIKKFDRLSQRQKQDLLNFLRSL